MRTTRRSWTDCGDSAAGNSRASRGGTSAASPTSSPSCANSRCSPTSASERPATTRRVASRRATASRARQDGSELELLVLGMGKLGGGELNFSSDIDLVFLFPEHGETDGQAAARARGVLHAARPTARAAAGHGDGRGVRVPRGPAVAAVRGIRAAGRELRRLRGLPAAARPGLGTLRLREGAAGARGQAIRRTPSQRPAALRLSAVSRLSRVRIAARNEIAHFARGRASRPAGQRQARARRDPRDRVHRPGVPADPRRRRPAPADAEPARGAAAARGPEAPADRDRGGAS